MRDCHSLTCGMIVVITFVACLVFPPPKAMARSLCEGRCESDDLISLKHYWNTQGRQDVSFERFFRGLLGSLNQSSALRDRLLRLATVYIDCMSACEIPHSKRTMPMAQTIGNDNNRMVDLYHEVEEALDGTRSFLV